MHTCTSQSLICRYNLDATTQVTVTTKCNMNRFSAFVVGALLLYLARWLGKSKVFCYASGASLSVLVLLLSSVHSALCTCYNQNPRSACAKAGVHACINACTHCGVYGKMRTFVCASMCRRVRARAVQSLSCMCASERDPFVRMYGCMQRSLSLSIVRARFLYCAVYTYLYIHLQMHNGAAVDSWAQHCC